MRRHPRRRGISLGTVTMLAVTGLVVLGCFWLFPRLMGNTDFQFDASQLAVAIDDSYTAITSNGDNGSAEPANTPLVAVPTSQPVLVTKPTQLSFTLTATGSIQINSAVQKAMTDETSGYQFPLMFEALRDEIKADLSIVTLENTVISTDKLTDVNVPVDVLNALKQNQFSAVCFGHYNALNGGVKGIAATKEAAIAAGLTPYGVYATQEERNTSTIININDVSVALLSYQNDISSTGKKKISKDEQSFAIASATLPTISADIQAARAAGAQVVIVSLCWGKTNATSPTQTQKDLAQGIANAGGDIILGTHPGALQTIELLDATRSDGRKSQTLCAYSLGNLFTYDRDRRTAISGILLHAKVQYDLNSETVQFDGLTYTPTYVWRGKVDDKTTYRVLVSDMSAPSFMQDDQQNIMDRCLALVQDVLKDTPIALRKVDAALVGID